MFSGCVLALARAFGTERGRPGVSVDEAGAAYQDPLIRALDLMRARMTLLGVGSGTWWAGESRLATQHKTPVVLPKRERRELVWA
jgi:hypothetical protein